MRVNVLAPKFMSRTDFWSYIGLTGWRASLGSAVLFCLSSRSIFGCFSGGSLTVVPLRHSLTLECSKSASPWDLFIWQTTETTLTGKYSSSDWRSRSILLWAIPVTLESSFSPILSTADRIAFLIFRLTRASRSGSFS